MEDCIFCKIVKGEIPSFKVYEDDKVYAFGDINPASKGHTLVIPKNHAENLFEISEEDLAALHKAAKKIAGAIKTSLSAEGIATLQLNGPAVGQEVMHYHLHLVPRLPGEPALPMSHWELKPGNMEEIGQVMEKIAAGVK